MKETPEAKYEESFVAYLDILGFKDRIKRSHNQFEVGRIRKDLEYAQKLGTNWTNTEIEKFRCKCLSDSISMSVPFGHGTLSRFLIHVLQLQGQLTCRGVFLRGAIVAGEHFEDDNILFGPTLIRAIELEEMVALWPRVVVHPEVMRLVSERDLWLKPEKKEEEQKFLKGGDGKKGLLRCDHDGIWYLDYLGKFPSKDWVILGPPVLPQPQGDDYLAIHRDKIIEKAKEAGSDLRVFAKYYWVASYHNSTVKKKRLRIQLSELLSRI